MIFLPKEGSVWKGYARQNYTLKITGGRRGRIGFVVAYQFLPIRTTLDQATTNTMTYKHWKFLVTAGHIKEYKDGLALAVERLR